MRNNIIIKSMLRQRVRTGVLVLLIAAASYMFVVRTVEYVVVSDRIGAIGSFYHSIGYFNTGRQFDVSDAVEALRDSPYIGFENRMRLASGVLRNGLLSPDIHGGGTLMLPRQYDEYENIPAYAFFTGKLIGKENHFAPPANDMFMGIPDDLAAIIGLNKDPRKYIALTFEAEDVAAAFPELVTEGQELTVRYYLTSSENAALSAEARHDGAHGEMPGIQTAVDGMEIGGRYFVRGVWPVEATREHWLPEENSSLGWLEMVPVNTDTSELHPIDPSEGESLWHIPVPHGESLDSGAPGLEWLGGEIERGRHRLHTVQIRTAADMRYLPLTQPRFLVEVAFEGVEDDGSYDDYQSWALPEGKLLQLVEGRLLTIEDHKSENPVAVIHKEFARMRGLEIGDTIAVGVPREHIAVGMLSPVNVTTGRLLITPEGSSGYGTVVYEEIFVNSFPQESYECELELTIVGTYNLGTPIIEHDPSSAFLANTAWFSAIYIPDSLLPADITLEYFDRPILPRSLRGAVDPIQAQHYSFVLANARDRDAFLLEHREALSDAGMLMPAFYENGDAVNFWESAEPVLNALAFNITLYGIVLAMILALVAFLYLRQRKKDFAIMRALGTTAKRIKQQLAWSFALFAAPAALAGGIGGWALAIDVSSETLAPIGEFASYFDIDPQANLPAFWLPVLVAAIFAVLLAATMAGASRILRRPVLVQLQGTSAATAAAGTPPSLPVGSTVGAQVQTAAETLPRSLAGADLDAGGAGAGPSAGTKTSKSANIKGSVRFVYRHAVRSKAKSLLVVAVAVLLVLAQGFLLETVRLSESEVDSLYETIAVKASVVADIAALGRNMSVFLTNDMIRESAVSEVLGSGLARNEYLESTIRFSRIINANGDGSFPENWAELYGFEYEDTSFYAGVVRTLDSFSGLLATNDIGRFAEMNSISKEESLNVVRDFPPEQDLDGNLRSDPVGDLVYGFADGFDESGFVYSSGSPVPVILSERTMELQGISLGDHVYILANCLDGDGHFEGWNHIGAVVVGSHNRNVTQIMDIYYYWLRDVILIPLGAMEHIMGGNMRYSLFEFEMEPGHARELDATKAEIRAILKRPEAGLVGLDVLFQDEELRVVVGSVVQTISLLWRLYPVAVALSVVIGFGLSFLLILQNAKNAAIMRILGSTKSRTRAILWSEQALVCLIGLLIGLAAVMLMLWGVQESAALAGLYLAGALAGAAAGSVLVTNRSPLELLQVRE